MVYNVKQLKDLGQETQPMAKKSQARQQVAEWSSRRNLLMEW